MHFGAESEDSAGCTDSDSVSRVSHVSMEICLGFTSTLQVPAGSAQPAEKFPCGLVHRMRQDFLSSRLEAMDYSAPSCGGLVKALSEEVKALMRTVCPDRYRLVCTVALGQLGPEGQQGYGGLVLASRSLWDPHTDTSLQSLTVCPICMNDSSAVLCKTVIIIFGVYLNKTNVFMYTSCEV
uniref:Uncharacterized protein n=1 Tax=Oncorhynchus tshawytscha TaxID=74940 RepID=A0A8C8K908_ONCTS